MAQLTPVVKWLLILNIGIYFIDIFLKGDARDGPLRSFGAFTIQSGIFSGHVWEFITFQFIHGGILHVLFNSIGLFFFGPWMERWWGAKKFLLFYLACGVGGALFYTLLIYLKILPSSVVVAVDQFGRAVLVERPLVGASAGIYGILIGVAIIAPSLRVALLIPPVTLTMRQLALILLLISVGSIAFKIGGNEGGEAGHLGGAIVGFILMKFAGMKGSGRFALFGGRSKGPRRDIEPKIRPRTKVDLRSQSEIDEILDKISRDGFQSLSDAERDLLHRAAKSQE